MFMEMTRLENIARASMGGNVDNSDSDPLPPGPNYGPFGYFRLGVLALAGLIAVLLIAMAI